MNALSYRPLWTCSRCRGVTFHGTGENFAHHEREHPGSHASYQMVTREAHVEAGWDVTQYPVYIS